MADADYQELGLLPKAVILIAIALFVTGTLWHGASLKVVEQLWHDLIERPDGPMRFRFVLQPLMATIVAIRDGLNDARSGRSPSFAAVLGNPQERAGLLREGLNSTARIIALGLVMDVIYQAIVFKTFYRDQALVVALVLAFVPYFIIRAITARIRRARRSG
jgi:drug/metabolite transporter (DMT)-like permease